MRLIGLPLGGSAIPFHCIELGVPISKKIEAGGEAGLGLPGPKVRHGGAASKVQAESDEQRFKAADFLTRESLPGRFA